MVTELTPDIRERTISKSGAFVNKDLVGFMRQAAGNLDGVIFEEVGDKLADGTQKP